MDAPIHFASLNHLLTFSPVELQDILKERHSEAVANSSMPAMHGMSELIGELQAAGVPYIFVSSRDPALSRGTIDNLTSEGLIGDPPVDVHLVGPMTGAKPGFLADLEAAGTKLLGQFDDVDADLLHPDRSYRIPVPR